MPQIPVFDADLRYQQPAMPQANPAIAGLPGEALARGGEAISQEAYEFNQQLLEANRQMKIADLAKQGVDASSAAAFKYEKVADPDEAYAGYQNEMQVTRANLLEGAGDDPKVQAGVLREFDYLTGSTAAEVRAKSFALKSSNVVAGLLGNLDDYSHKIAAADNDNQRQALTTIGNNSIDGAVSGGYLAPEAGENLRRRFQGSIDLARARQDVFDDPAGALKRLNDGTSYPHLNEDARPVLENKAQNAVYQLAAEAEKAQRDREVAAQATVLSTYQDDLAAIGRTGHAVSMLSPGQIAAAYPAARYPGVAAGMIANLDRAQRYYTAGQKVALNSPQEDAALLKDWTPAGAGFAAQAKAQDDLAAAIQAKHTALANDPAGYVVQKSPQVAQLFQAAAKDPAQLPAAAAALDATYDRLGVPAEDRRVLPEDSARAMVQQLVSAAPEARAGQLSAMAQTFGALWPRLMGDLVKAKLPPEYEVLAALPDPASRTAFADAIGAGKEKIRGGLAEEDAKAIDQAIDNSQAVADLRRSLSYAAGGSAKAAELTQAMKLLAYRFGAATDPNEAAARAVASVTTDRSEFWRQGGGIARVPKGALDATEDAANAALAKLGPADLAPASNVTGVPLTPQQLQQTALEGAKGGKWVTNEGETGLVRIGADGRPVMLASGGRLEVPFPAAPGAPIPAPAAALPASLPAPAGSILPGATARRMSADVERGAASQPRPATRRHPFVAPSFGDQP